MGTFESRLRRLEVVVPRQHASDEDIELQVTQLEACICATLVTPLLCQGDWKQRHRSIHTPPAAAEEAIRRYEHELLHAKTDIEHLLQQLRSLVREDDTAWSARVSRLRQTWLRTVPARSLAVAHRVADDYLPSVYTADARSAKAQGRSGRTDSTPSRPPADLSASRKWRTT